jgi:tetratricopeptide (TPR) repeat protein
MECDRFLAGSCWRCPEPYPIDVKKAGESIVRVLIVLSLGVSLTHLMNTPLKKIMLFFFFGFTGLAGIAQTDKYTEKLQELFAEEDYYKITEYQSKKEPEMASISLFFKGLAWFMLDYERTAIGYFDNAIEKGPPTADMYFYKGVSHFILEEYDEAIEALTAAIEMDAYGSNYANVLGRAYYFKDDFTTAIAWLEKASDLEKEDHELYLMMGECHLELRNYDDAIANFKKAYEFAPRYKEKKQAHYFIAEAQYLQGNYEAAKETVNKHLLEFKSDYDALSLLIQTLYALNQMDDAAAQEEKMNKAKAEDLAFPKSMANMYCIDRFEVKSDKVNVFRAYTDQSYQAYLWRHRFVVCDEDGKELFTIETQLDSAAGNENTYTICKPQGDTLLKYGTILYDENFDYYALMETAKKIIAGELEPAERVTGYEAWLKSMKSGSGGDGSSFETAIIVNSIPEEYQYLRENYPGHKFIMQSLVSHDGVPYDILQIKTSEGETLEIYFNISSFFGKW